MYEVVVGVRVKGEGNGMKRENMKKKKRNKKKRPNQSINLNQLINHSSDSYMDTPRSETKPKQSRPEKNRGDWIRGRGRNTRRW